MQPYRVSHPLLLQTSTKSNSHTVRNLIWRKVTVGELFVPIPFSNETDDFIKILAELLHNLFHRLLNKMFIRIHPQKQLVAKEDTHKQTKSVRKSLKEMLIMTTGKNA